MEIAKLYTEEGPFVSAYLPAETSEKTSEHVRMRWESVRRRLRSEGADDATLDAVGAEFLSGNPGEGRVVYGAGGRVLHHDEVHYAPPREDGWFGQLPHVLPYLSDLQERVPYVLVRIDREGALVESYACLGKLVASREVVGSHDELRKVQVGGWAHRRIQERAEDSWKGNAKEVVDVAAAMAQDVGAELVLLSGGNHMVTHFQTHLPGHLRGKVFPLATGHSRRADGGEATLQSEVERVVTHHAALRRQGPIEQFRQERGQADRAADGVLATLDALMLAQVDTLILYDPRGEDKSLFTGEEAWYGPDATQVACEPDRIEAMGAAPQRGPFDDVVVRAAVGTGAKVLLVDDPDLLSGGVGALLRYHRVNVGE